MTKVLVAIIVWLIALSAIVSAGPAIVALTNALVPLVLVVGAVVAVLKLVWHFTSWHR